PAPWPWRRGPGSGPAMPDGSRPRRGRTWRRRRPTATTAGRRPGSATSARAVLADPGIVVADLLVPPTGEAALELHGVGLHVGVGEVVAGRPLQRRRQPAGVERHRVEGRRQPRPRQVGP